MSKRSRKKNRGWASMEEALTASRLKKKMSTLLPLYRLQSRWPDWVGDMLASQSYPKLIKDDELVLGVLHPSCSMHFEFIKDALFKTIEKDTGMIFATFGFQNVMKIPDRRKKMNTKENSQSKEEDPRSLDEVIESLRAKVLKN